LDWEEFWEELTGRFGDPCPQENGIGQSHLFASRTESVHDARYPPGGVATPERLRFWTPLHASEKSKKRGASRP